MTREERETIILFNEADDFATIETFNTGYKKKLDKLCKEYPQMFSILSEDETNGVKKYWIPKRYIRIGSPRTMSEEMKEVASKRMKEYHNRKREESDFD